MMFEHLLLPTSIGKLELKNKIVMAPLGTGFFDHGFVTERVKNQGRIIVLSLSNLMYVIN